MVSELLIYLNKVVFKNLKKVNSNLKKNCVVETWLDLGLLVELFRASTMFYTLMPLGPLWTSWNKVQILIASKIKVLDFYYALKGILDPVEVKNNCVKGRLDIELAVNSYTKFLFLYTALKYIPSYV